MLRVSTGEILHQPAGQYIYYVSQQFCPTPAFIQLAHSIGERSIGPMGSQPGEGQLSMARLQEDMRLSYETGRFAGALALNGREEEPVGVAWADSDEPRGILARRYKLATSRHFKARLRGVYILPEFRDIVEPHRLVDKLKHQLRDRHRWVE